MDSYRVITYCVIWINLYWLSHSSGMIGWDGHIGLSVLAMGLGSSHIVHSIPTIESIGVMMFIPWKTWEQQLIHLGGWHFSCHKTGQFKPKVMLQVEVSNIELLMLASHLMMNSLLKNIQRYFCGMHGMFLWECEEDKGTNFVHGR